MRLKVGFATCRSNIVWAAIIVEPANKITK